jgi:hypothetical protein
MCGYASDLLGFRLSMKWFDLPGDAVVPRSADAWLRELLTAPDAEIALLPGQLVEFAELRT